MKPQFTRQAQTQKEEAKWIFAGLAGGLVIPIYRQGLRARAADAST